MRVARTKGDQWSAKAVLLRTLAFSLILLFINASIAAKLFVVEYTGYLESNEGSFIAISRQISAHPKDLLWWRLWDCGLPFQNTYLPFLQVVVAGFSKASGHPIALSFHQVTAFFYCVGPVMLYLTAWKVTQRPWQSFLAALTYSLFSFCAWLVPSIRIDLGGLWNLRRLQGVAYYGEAPLAVSMALLPLAILFLYGTFSNGRSWTKVAAGIAMGTTILANAFGAVILGIVGLCMLVSVRTERVWRNLIAVSTIGILCYAWISPLLPPSVISAIRLNSPTVEADYRFNGRSLVGVCLLATSFASAWWLTRHFRSPWLRFVLLFTLVCSGIVVLGGDWEMYVVPQPHRYQLAMDMGWALFGVFGISEVLKFKAPRLIGTAAAILIIGLALQYRHVLNYAHREIRSQDMTLTPAYRAARWMEQNMGGERVDISGSHSFHFNDFTDIPQLFGGHETMLPNFVMRIAYYVIHRGEDVGDVGPEISILWLKALGAHAILVPDQGIGIYYKPFANPRKFDGTLQAVWREGGDTIYAVPARSNSLAHVVPDGALVKHVPIHGLDVGEIRAYVRALDDAELPEALLVWANYHTALVHAYLRPDQTISIQMTYGPGWRAEVNGRTQNVEKDGLGFLAFKPQCNGDCQITLIYDGGPEWRATCIASLLAMILALGSVFRRGRLRVSTTRAGDARRRSLPLHALPRTTQPPPQ